MLRTSFAGRAAVLLLGVSVTTCAWATAQRTFVASNGDDLNVCAITAPCRSFARAITQTNAKGEIIVLDSAGYGPVVVDKSVAILAPTGVYAGISVFTGDGVVINGSGIEVLLRGLTINGQGGDRGIFYTFGARLTIERCIVRNMTSHGVATNFGGDVSIEGSVISDNGGNGVDIVGNPDVVIAGTSVERNQSGVYYHSTFGTAAKLVVVDSRLVGNADNGVFLLVTNVAAALTVANSTLARNGAGVAIRSDSAPATGVITGNTIVHNGFQGVVSISFGGAGVVTAALTENVVSDNQTGVRSFETGSLLVLDRNTITHNFTGVQRASSGEIETRSNNTVRENTVNTSGTPFTPVGAI